MFTDTLDSLNPNVWAVSDFAVAASWNQTAWNSDYLQLSQGEVRLNFDGVDTDGKDFTGAELQSQQFYGYGSYEVVMAPSDTSGVVSSFFLYNNTFFGGSQHNEIDIEFLGDDTTQIHLNYYYGAERLGAHQTVVVDLGFDAAAALHNYRIDWLPGGISWYVDDALIFTVPATTAPVPIPDEGMKMFMNIWTGGAGLQDWHGPVAPNATGVARYDSISYRPVLAPVEGTEGHDRLKAVPFMPSVVSGYAGDDGLQGGDGGDLILGGTGRDWIRGHGGKDTLDGGAGQDDLGGGAGMDTFLWDIDSLGPWRDRVDDFNSAEGDVIDLSAISAAYGWDAAAAAAAVWVSASARGTNINIDVPGMGLLPLAELRGVAPEQISVAAGTLRLVAGPPPGSADDDGNMALALGPGMMDATIEAGEEAAVALILSGLDADATAVVTVLDGAGGSVSAPLAADGTALLDVSTLTDGAALTRVTATDIDGNTTTVNGPGLVLDFAPDTSADADGNLGVAAPDMAIDASEVAAVTLVATGLDADATAVITVSDGAASVVSGVLTPGSATAVLDLSGLSDGPLSTSITATDTSGNVTAAIAGPALTLDTVSDPVPQNAITGTPGDDWLTGTSGDDLILGGAGRDRLRGEGGNDTLEGGAGQDNLGGGAGADSFVWGPDALAGGRDRVEDFNPADGDVIDLSAISAAYGWDAAAAAAAVSVTSSYLGVIISVDVPGTGAVALAELRGVAPEQISVAAGTLRLVAGPPPGSADDNGNMALALGPGMMDATIEAGEEAAVALILSGLDADATAVVTVLDGAGGSVSAPLAADGTALLDVSTLTDGAALTRVTATDIDGNTTTVNGPGLVLDFAPDTSADADGNLGVAAPDMAIDASEVAAVTLVATGLDADATAVITVSDGTASVVSGVLTPGSATAVLDLSGLSDGPLSTSITATDTSGNVTAAIAGPALTLDTVSDPVPQNAITGTPGDDWLTGTSGDDLILGGAGRDRLRGEGGNDTLEGGAGQDNLGGGAGADSFVWGPDALAGGRDRVEDFNPADGDVIDLSAISAAYGWDAAAAAAAVSVTSSYLGVIISVDVPGTGAVALAELRGVAPEQISVAAGTLRLVAGPPPGSADDDGNMALALGPGMMDATIEAGEEAAVALILSGLDADATAVVTVLDGAGGSVSAPLAADGTALLDVSTLTDGAALTRVTATDIDGNTTTVNGPGLVLDFAPDTSADADGNLGVAAPDMAIDASEVAAVTLVATGLDADATAVITVSDGTASVVSGVLTPGSATAVLDLSGLSDGPLSTSITATDTSGNVTAAIAGPALTLDTVSDPVPQNAITGTPGDDWLTGTSGDDLILGGAGRDRLRGEGGNDTLEGGAGQDNLGGGAGADSFVWGPDALAGGRDRVEDFNPADGDVIDLSAISAAYGWDAAAAAAAVSVTSSYLGVIISVDVPGTGAVALAELRGVAPEQISVAAGTLRLVAGPPPGSADDDGNMALALGPGMMDATIEAGEEAAVALILSGLDADATAVVTVLDGAGGSVSAPLAADGTALLDVSTLTDGAALTRVTATDIDGNTTTVNGPGLVLDFAPDTSADADGNLGVAAPDMAIDASEVAAVTLVATGLDADATAVITVSDGTASVVSGVLTPGSATAVLDLSGLSDGPLSTSITATDTSGNVTAAIAGPALTLDTVSDPVPQNAITGTPGDDWLTGTSGDDLILGGAGRDRLRGEGGNDTLEGGAGQDNLGGGAGADSFVWGPDALAGGRDRVEDFNPADGDVIDLSAISAAYGWDAAAAAAAVSVTSSYLGVIISVDVPGTGAVALAELRGVAPEQISVAAGTLRLVAGPPPGSADDDGNMALALGPGMMDATIEAGEEAAVALILSGLDADATAVVTVLDGAGGSVSAPLAADGTALLDVSTLTDGAALTRVTATDIDGNTTTVNGPGLFIAIDGLDGALFAARTEGLLIDLDADRYAQAPKVLPIGDSITQGIVDGTESAAERDGYRGDLLDSIITAGGWIDYVGAFSNGPSTMLDRDHSGEPAIPLRLIVGSGRDSDLSDNLAQHAPDVTLLMAGTNDFEFRSGNFFSAHLPGILDNIDKAVTQFYQQPDAGEKYLVISTIAPKLANDVPVEYAHFINEGYSTVGGGAVAGDAGNGTYVSGLRALVEDLQGAHETLLLFDNPHGQVPSTPAEGVDHLSNDDVHYTEAAYGEYADALFALIETETGLFSGSGLDWQVMPSGLEDVTGGRAGDRITGSAGDNVIDGAGGADLIEGGGGADTFVFNMDTAQTGTTDRILDFSATEGDMLDVRGISQHFGWTTEGTAALGFDLSVNGSGVELRLTDPDGAQFALAYLAGLTLSDISATSDIFYV